MIQPVRSRVPWHVKALLAIVFWGASFIATKPVLREVGPFTIVTTRFGLGIAVLALTVAARGQMGSMKPRRIN